MCLLHAGQNELFHQKWQAAQRFEKLKGFNISWELWPNNCRTPYQDSMWSPVGSTRQTKYQGSKFGLVDSNISVYRSHQKHLVMTQHPQTSWTFASQIWGAPTVSPNLFRLMAFHMFPHPVLKRRLRWQECMQRRNVSSCFFCGGWMLHIENCKTLRDWLANQWLVQVVSSQKQCNYCKTRVCLVAARSVCHSVSI